MAFSDLDSSDGFQALKGATDDTPIGNVGDRLKVDSIVSNIPTIKAHHSVVQLANGAATDMNVNGSVTPVVFSSGPGAGITWYVDSITFQFSDTGASKLNDWGAINGGLTNGLLCESLINSTARTLFNLKQNRGVVSVFSDGGFAGGNSGFITDANFYSGLLNTFPGFTLIGDDGDLIRATVRDDLTGLTSQSMRIHYWMVVT